MPSKSHMRHRLTVWEKWEAPLLGLWKPQCGHNSRTLDTSAIPWPVLAHWKIPILQNCVLLGGFKFIYKRLFKQVQRAWPLWMNHHDTWFVQYSKHLSSSNIPTQLLSHLFALHSILLKTISFKKQTKKKLKKNRLSPFSPPIPFQINSIHLFMLTTPLNHTIQRHQWILDCQIKWSI